MKVILLDENGMEELWYVFSGMSEESKEGHTWLSIASVSLLTNMDNQNRMGWWQHVLWLPLFLLASVSLFHFKYANSLAMFGCFFLNSFYFYSLCKPFSQLSFFVLLLFVFKPPSLFVFSFLHLFPCLHSLATTLMLY